MGSVDEAGDTISYQVIISNAGDVSLQGSLADPLPGIYAMSGPIESGGTIAGWLEPGENWTYTYKYNAKQSDIASNGINKNGVADGDGDIDNEATFTNNYANSQSDIEDVPILRACRHIEKNTDGQDDDGPKGPYIEVGGNVIWEYVVTNCGSVNLTDIVVTDDNGTPTDLGDDWNPTYVSGDNEDNILQTTEAWIYQANSSATAVQYANTAYVTGTALPEGGPCLTATTHATTVASRRLGDLSREQATRAAALGRLACSHCRWCKSAGAKAATPDIEESIVKAQFISAPPRGSHPALRSLVVASEARQSDRLDSQHDCGATF